MADEIKLKAPTVEQQVVVNINGEEKLRSFADTLDKISNNKNLQKYWKTQQELINATANAYGNFQKKASKDNATELIKVTNALKAMSGTDLSNILPDFDKISKAMVEAQKVAGNIDSAFSVKGFKEAFDSFETLKAYSEDIEKIFSHFGVSSDVSELQNNVRVLEGEVEKLTRRLSNAKNANEELRNEFENFKSGSGFADKLDELDNLKSKMSYLRKEASETFKTFLKSSNVVTKTEDGYGGFDYDFDDYRFERYFEAIREGSMTAQQAIADFKLQYDYLLRDNENNNSDFGLEQLQAFSSKLDSIFRQVEETSTKINDIISNGVITKSVENLSMDSSLSDSQRSLFGNLLQDEESLKSITALFQKLIEESNKTSKVDLFNDEQLQQVLSIFDMMEKHLSSLRSIISDVGDGEEFSPLLKALNDIKEATSNIKLNFNMDLGDEVSERLNQKVSQASARQLEAYRKLFSAMKGTKKTNNEMLKFFEPDEASVSELIGMYKGIIERAEKQFKVGNSNVYKKYLGAEYDALKREITNANKQLSRADSKRSENGILGDLFGNTKDLSEVIEQLNKIVSKLDEISSSANEFKNEFKEGFNVTASIEEIDKLTNRVKELEDELSKIKLNPVNVDKSNISSENQNKQLLEGEEIRKNLYKINDEIGLSEEEFIQKLRQENEEVKNGNRQFQERLALLKDGKVVASYFGDKASMNIHNSDLVDSFDKVIHSHSPIEGSSVPSFEDLDLIFGKYKSEIKDFVLFYNNEMRSLQAPGDMSLLGSEFRDYGKFLDAISSLTSNSSIYSNYANNYLASIAEEAGVAYKQIDALGNEINSQRINTSDWEIILETMRQLTNMHRSQNQDAEFSQIAERGKELSNTFIDSKNAAEQFEISVESLYDILIKLWKSVENDGGKTAFKQLREQLTSLSSDNIKDILYGDEMFYDADGDANELKQVAQKIYDNYYLPLINGAKELKSETNSPIKDVFQGGTTSAEKLEENIKNVESATDRATESAKEYRKILSQVGEFDIDSKVSAMYKRNDGQLESWTWRAKTDDEGKVLRDQNGRIEDYGDPTVTVISKYEQLEKIIVKADNELRNLQKDLAEIKAYDPTASTTNIEAKISDQKEYIRLLEQTIKVISQSDEYLLDEQQIIDARNKAAREYALTMGSKQEKTDAKQSASDEKKRLANIEQVNRALNKQQITIDAIEKTYNKKANPDLDREVSNQQDLAELAQKKLDIQTKINLLQGQERNSANEKEFLELEKLIAEYKELAKYKLKANNPSKQELGGQNLQTLIQVQISNYDRLIKKAEKYGDATSETVEKLKEQRDILSKISADGKYTATADQYYASRDTYKVESAALSAFETETKAAEQETKAIQKLAGEKRKLRQQEKQSTQSSVDKALTDQVSAWKKIQSIREKIAKTDNADEINALQESKKHYQEQYNNANKILKANDDLYDKESQIARLEQVRLETNAKIAGYKKDISLSSMKSELKTFNNQIPKKPIDGKRSDYFEGLVQNYKKAIKEAQKYLDTLGDSPITKEVKDEWERLIDLIKIAKEEMDAVPNAARGSDADARMKEIDKLTKYLDKNTRISKEAREQLEGYLALLKSGDPSVNVKELHTAWTKVAVAEREAGREGKSFLDIFKNKVVYNYAAQLAGYYLSFMDMIRYARNAVSAVQELDTALVDLKKTTTMSASELERFYYDSNDVAKRMGATTASIIEQASAWSRLGFSTKEQATQMAELSSQFASISPGMSTDDAQEGLVSIMKAWDISTDQVEREVMDNINILGNRFAETNQDIVEGMKRSAATFAALGQTWTDSFAIFTGAQEVIQNAETVGKNISAYLYSNVMKIKVAISVKIQRWIRPR